MYFPQLKMSQLSEKWLVQVPRLSTALRAEVQCGTVLYPGNAICAFSVGMAASWDKGCSGYE